MRCTEQKKNVLNATYGINALCLDGPPVRLGLEGLSEQSRGVIVDERESVLQPHSGIFFNTQRSFKDCEILLRLSSRHVDVRIIVYTLAKNSRAYFLNHGLRIFLIL